LIKYYEKGEVVMFVSETNLPMIGVILQFKNNTYMIEYSSVFDGDDHLSYEFVAPEQVSCRLPSKICIKSK